MKIATYNINGINGRLTNLLRWLDEANPDVVCLQELKSTDRKFPQRTLLDAGYHAIWQGQQSWNGGYLDRGWGMKFLGFECAQQWVGVRAFRLTVVIIGAVERS